MCTCGESIRENQRLAEIGNGSQPNWHQQTDLFMTYSEADYIFGFKYRTNYNGTVAELQPVSQSKSISR
jgi:hypothetical protein